MHGVNDADFSPHSLSFGLIVTNTTLCFFSGCSLGVRRIGSAFFFFVYSLKADTIMSFSSSDHHLLCDLVFLLKSILS
jgi:hypothetical protein